MFTVRAILKDNAVTFLESVDLPAGAKQPILVTFLDKNITEFGDLSLRGPIENGGQFTFQLE